MKLIFVLLTLFCAKSVAVNTFAAKYHIEFTSFFCDLQSNNNYPANCPVNPHTSPVFGGAHNDAFQLWRIGGFATDGLKQLAETGASTMISEEWLAHVNNGDALPGNSAPGISGVGKVTFDVTVDRDHSLFSFASMLAPSPDWFVGLDSLELWDNTKNCWKQDVSLDLDAIDAGTDGGSPTTPFSNIYDHFTRPDDPLEPRTFIQTSAMTNSVWRETDGIIGTLKITLLGGVTTAPVHDPTTVPTAPTAPSNPIVFTFAFDDTFKDGLAMAEYLDEYDWHGTFYISALRLCLHPDYLNRVNVNSLFRRGHQIGGHTLSHSQMLDLSENALNTQICCNRGLLTEYKWSPTTFAYPFAHYNHTIRRAVQKCGYCNARSTSAGLRSVNCPTCEPGESIPPVDKWKMRSYSVLTTDTFQILKERIDNAIRHPTGKWVIFNFHKLCKESGDHCNTRYRYSILKNDYANLVEYLRGLQLQGVAQIKTVKEVMHAFNGPVPVVPRSYQISFDSDEISLTDRDSSASIALVASFTMLIALLLA